MKTFIDTFSKQFSTYSRKATVYKTGKNSYRVEQEVNGSKYKPSTFTDEKSACDYAKKVTHNGDKVNSKVSDVRLNGNELLNSDGVNDMEIYATPKNNSLDNEKMERQVIQKFISNPDNGPTYYHAEVSLEPWNSPLKYRVRFWTNKTSDEQLSYNYKSQVAAISKAKAYVELSYELDKSTFELINK